MERIDWLTPQDEDIKMTMPSKDELAIKNNKMNVSTLIRPLKP